MWTGISSITPPSAYANHGKQNSHFENGGTGKLYFLMWGHNDTPSLNQPHKNVVLVYNNVVQKNASGKITSYNTPTYETKADIDNGTSTDIKFEMEGVGFATGSTKLWFQTYEWIYKPENKGLNGGIYTDSQNIK